MVLHVVHHTIHINSTVVVVVLVVRYVFLVVYGAGHLQTVLIPLIKFFVQVKITLFVLIICLLMGNTNGGYGNLIIKIVLNGVYFATNVLVTAQLHAGKVYVDSKGGAPVIIVLACAITK